MNKLDMILQIKIDRFLIECNTLMDGLYMEEISEPDAPWVKFEIKPTCIYFTQGFQAPTEVFHKCRNEAAKKHLGVEPDEWDCNNTGCIFWINKEDINI